MMLRMFYESVVVSKEADANRLNKLIHKAGDVGGKLVSHSNTKKEDVVLATGYLGTNSMMYWLKVGVVSACC